QGALVHRVAVRVEEADGQGLHAGFLESSDGRAGRGRIERRRDAAVGHDPLRDFETQMPRHERRGLIDEQVVHVVAALAPNLDGVAESRRGEETGARTLTLDEGVGGERRPVDERAHVGGRAARVIQHADHALLDGLRGILGRGEELAEGEGARAVVDPDQVREGAADVHADARLPGERCHGAECIRRRPMRVKAAGDGYWLPRYEETKVPEVSRLAKRESRNGVGFTGGADPVMSAAIISPTAGASLKPWPDMPAATKKPASAVSSRIGIQSGVMSKAPAQPRA